jgi:hypothetical protein
MVHTARLYRLYCFLMLNKTRAERLRCAYRLKRFSGTHSRFESRASSEVRQPSRACAPLLPPVSCCVCCVCMTRFPLAWLPRGGGSLRGVAFNTTLIMRACVQNSVVSDPPVRLRRTQAGAAEHSG